MKAVENLLRLTPVYEDVDGGWTQARLVELPAVITAAPTRDEAQDLLLDALREFLLSFGPENTSESTRVDAETLTLAVRIGSSSAA